MKRLVLALAMLMSTQAFAETKTCEDVIRVFAEENLNRGLNGPQLDSSADAIVVAFSSEDGSEGSQLFIVYDSEEWDPNEGVRKTDNGKCIIQGKVLDYVRFDKGERI